MGHRRAISRDQAWGPADELIFDGSSSLGVTVFQLSDASSSLSYRYFPVLRKTDIEEANDALRREDSPPLYIKWSEVRAPTHRIEGPARPKRIRGRTHFSLRRSLRHV